jgi:hypothetical protein
MGNFRVVNGRELDKIMEAKSNHLVWNSLRDYALKYYGPNAHRVDVELEGQSDDEGGSYYYISYISVEDVNKNFLEILPIPLNELSYWAEDIAPLYEELEQERLEWEEEHTEPFDPTEADVWGRIQDQLDEFLRDSRDLDAPQHETKFYIQDFNQFPDINLYVLED